MKAVLYTYDLEPITVIDLPEWAEDYLIHQGMVRLAVMPPLTKAMLHCTDPEKMTCCKTVTIIAERLCFRGKYSTLLITGDDESALLLQAAFLPGQTRGVQAKEQQAFARGFLHALDRLGKI